MITFKQFLLQEDIFVSGDELLAAVNPGTDRKPSEPNRIATNRRPLGRQAGLTRGQDVFYAFSYKPSDAPGGSTDLLKSFKGKGPFKFSAARRAKFIDETTTHMAAEFKKLGLKPDVIVAPQSSSDLLSDFANELADKIGVSAKKIGAFKKSDVPDFPDDKEAALELIAKKYVDLDYMNEKYRGDKAKRDAAVRSIAMSILRSIREHGSIAVKELDKRTSKFVANFMVSALEGDDEYSLIDKEVMVVDDVLSSGSTMSDLFRATKELGAAKVYGATLFARTSSTKAT